MIFCSHMNPKRSWFRHSFKSYQLLLTSVMYVPRLQTNQHLMQQMYWVSIPYLLVGHLLLESRTRSRRFIVSVMYIPKLQTNQRLIQQMNWVSIQYLSMGHLLLELAVLKSDLFGLQREELGSRSGWQMRRFWSNSTRRNQKPDAWVNRSFAFWSFQTPSRLSTFYN